MSHTPLHVIVIGGGIGGLCLAQGLKAVGVSVAVYERNQENVWLEGYRIHINPIGSRALQACLPPVLWEAFTVLAGKPPAGLGFLTEQLQELVVVGDEFMSHRDGNSANAHYPVSRLVLRHLLLTGMDDVLHFNKTFERYERSTDGKVTAYFSDGTSVTGDVLIGADGANSRVRQQYLPLAPRVEIGTIGVGGKLLLTDQSRAWLPVSLTTRMNLILPPDRYCVFTAAFEHGQESKGAFNSIQEKARVAGLDLDSEKLADTTENYILWAFLAQSDEHLAEMQDLDSDDLRKAVGQLIAKWHPNVRRLVAEVDPNSIGFNIFKASTLLSSWESSNVTLLGDAIHNMPPVGGLGGNMALRDAYSLVRALIAVHKGNAELLPAIQAYEAEMRRESFAAVRSALRYTKQITTTNRMQRLASRTWFRTCNTLPPLKRAFEDNWTKPMHNQSEFVSTM